jgi:hypothetical protein
MVRACMVWVCLLRFFSKLHSNVILFATSEGSPSRFIFTAYSVYVKTIVLIFGFKGQGGFGA